MPTPPLSQALDARLRLRSLVGPPKLLRELHYSALKTTDASAELFILAKCLEILRSILPGRNDIQRHKSLDEAIQGSVTILFITCSCWPTRVWTFATWSRLLWVRHFIPK